MYPPALSSNTTAKLPTHPLRIHTVVSHVVPLSFQIRSLAPLAASDAVIASNTALFRDETTAESR